MSSIPSESSVTSTRRDRRVVLAIGSSLGAAFLVLLALATSGFLAEQRRVKNAAVFSTLIGESSELGTISQRVALLQFGSLGRRDADLQGRLMSEVRGELQRFSGILEQVREHQRDDRIDPNGRARIHALLSQADLFRDTANRLQESILTGANDRELAAQMGDVVSKLVTASRLSADTLSASALRRAMADEDLAEQIYGVGIGAIILAGALAISFVLYKLKSELSLRRQSQQQLLRTNLELERFSAMVAHDLKGPLANIGLAAQMLSDESATTAGTRREFLGMISDETARLREMIQGLLRLSKVNVAELSLERISIQEMVGRVRRSLWKGLQDANARILITGEDSMRADPALLENLFQNLIENSLKYRNPEIDPEIRISAANSTGYFEILYRDNGVGIPRELREMVFEPFYQSPNHRSGNGVGLGLSVVKRIISAHRGTIEITDHEGPGTLFKMRFPLRGSRLDSTGSSTPALVPSSATI